jgi:hypothetical protein
MAKAISFTTSRACNKCLRRRLHRAGLATLDITTIRTRDSWVRIVRALEIRFISIFSIVRATRARGSQRINSIAIGLRVQGSRHGRLETPRVYQHRYINL